MTAHLSIGTSTNRVDLIATTYGFLVADWRPTAGEHESLFATSVVGDYEILQQYREMLVEETIVLVGEGTDPDDLIERLQNLRRALRDGLNYWVERFSTASVYLQAQGPCESNARYALVYDARLPDDGNPFAQPFIQSDGDSLMTELTLIVRRGPWLETAPGTGTCVQIAGYQADWCYPSYLEFDGVNDTVNCGSAATLDDLPDFAVAAKGQVTIDGWINPDTYGSGGFSCITSKGSQFLFGIDNGTGGLGGAGLWTYITCAGATAASFSGLDEFSVDGDWHHVLMTYDETGGGTPAARKVYLAIDGVWVVSYQLQQASVGNYVTDAASALSIGTGLGSYFDGSIGWVRVSNSVRYNPAGGNFTAPVRCTLPDSDANTMMLVIHEGTGATTYDLSGNANNGTITQAVWACDCETDFGQTTPTCSANTVYIANKSNVAQLTHIYYYDNAPGTWSGNLLGDTLPYAILPAVPAASDAVYFGIESTALDSGPFCSLVFNIGTASDITGSAWEYWSTAAGGSWVALTVQDNTADDGVGATGDAFDTTGIKSVHWTQSSTWTTASLVTAVGAGSPAVTGWWVRCRVTAVSVGVAPVVQTTQPYTITWPWVEVDEAQVPGDIDAWLRTKIRNQSHSGSTTAGLGWLQMMAGLRSQSRGADFTAYLNASDVQVPSFLTVTVPGGATVFASRSNSVTGRVVRCTNAVIETWSFDFASGYGSQYEGIYHAFLRAELTSGTTGAITVTPSITLGSDPLWTGEAVSLPTASAGNWNTIDLGRMEIPASSVLTSADNPYPLSIQIVVRGNGAADADFMDLVLVPVDEWAILAIGNNITYSYVGDRNTTSTSLLDVDSITNPRYSIRSLRRNNSTDAVSSIWQQRNNGPAILRRDRDQRLWFFRPQNGVTSTGILSPMETADTVQLYRQARYLSMRGDR